MLFSRLVSERDYIPSDDGGTISAKAFVCGKKGGQLETGLSFHLLNEAMEADRCAAYREHNKRDGKLPGVAVLTDGDFADQYVLLEPVQIEDGQDKVYGGQH